MKREIAGELPRFLDLLGLDEDPMGVLYTDEEPADGFTPPRAETPTREREMRNEIDWGAIFSRFSCVMGHIWRARRKRKAAYFDALHFGCPGGAFFLGYLKPQTETFRQMLDRYGESFLTTKTWATVRKKIERSRKAWGEQE
ncbi:MAG: DUF169 domain-containing protein [Thermodesulfobacteriota bacterium]